MSQLLGWGGPVLLFAAATVGSRRILDHFGLIACRAGSWGMAFLLGFTLYTTLVFWAAMAGVPVAAPLMTVAAGVIFSVGMVLPGRSPRETPPPWTPAEITAGVLVLVFFAFLIINALYFPVTAMDAHSYDGRARFLIHDASLNLNLYHWPGFEWSGSSNITYPPLFSLELATVYAFGGWQPKLVTACFAVAWLVMVYGVLRAHLPRLACLVWVLVLGGTPEIISHASYSLLNVPAMSLIAAEAVAWRTFARHGDRGWLVLAGVFAAGAAGVRPDAVVIHAAVSVAGIAAYFWRHRTRPHPRLVLTAVLVLGAPLVTWGVWTVYLEHVIGIPPFSAINESDGIGFDKVFYALWKVPLHFPTFGPVFYLWLASLPLFLVFARREGGSGFLHLSTVLVAAALTVTFANLDQNYGGGFREVLNSSFKRAVFYLVPLAGLATALSPPWTWLAERGRGWLFHPEAPSDP